MSFIRILSAGLFTTVQDLGRPGYAALGIAASGAADAVALRIGNRLVGSAAGAAALEMTLLGATVQFAAATWIALAGADCAASRSGPTGEASPVPMWTALPVAAGDILRCGAIHHGARTYLCIAGGLAVPQVLGSAATHVRSGLGGHYGRALRAKDELKVAASPPAPRPAHVAPAALQLLYPRATPRCLRITEGPQRPLFSATTFARLLATEYEVSARSDRMGVRLIARRLVVSAEAFPAENFPATAGEAVRQSIISAEAFPAENFAATAGELITEGVYLGAVQLPPDGQPIILGVDQQTTGGYPKPASVISADLPLLGQLRPADRVRFVAVSLSDADALLAEQVRLLDSPALVRE